MRIPEEELLIPPIHLLPLHVMLYLLIFEEGGVSLLNAAPYSDGRIAHVYERERPNGVHRLVSAECTLRFFVCFPRADVISKTWTTIFAFFLFFFALL